MIPALRANFAPKWRGSHGGCGIEFYGTFAIGCGGASVFYKIWARGCGCAIDFYGTFFFSSDFHLLSCFTALRALTFTVYRYLRYLRCSDFHTFFKKRWRVCVLRYLSALTFTVYCYLRYLSALTFTVYCYLRYLSSLFFFPFYRSDRTLTLYCVLRYLSAGLRWRVCVLRYLSASTFTVYCVLRYLSALTFTVYCYLRYLSALIFTVFSSPQGAPGTKKESL